MVVLIAMVTPRVPILTVDEAILVRDSN